MIHNHNNKQKPDWQLKDTTEGQKRMVIPVFVLSTKRIDSEMDPIEPPP